MNGNGNGKGKFTIEKLAEYVFFIMVGLLLVKYFLAASVFLLIVGAILVSIFAFYAKQIPLLLGAIVVLVAAIPGGFIISGISTTTIYVIGGVAALFAYVVPLLAEK